VEDVWASVLNQAVELPTTRARIEALTGASGAPQIVLRLGFGVEVKPTSRRALSEVLLEATNRPHSPHGGKSILKKRGGAESAKFLPNSGYHSPISGVTLLRETDSIKRPGAAMNGNNLSHTPPMGARVTAEELPSFHYVLLHEDEAAAQGAQRILVGLLTFCLQEFDTHLDQWRFDELMNPEFASEALELAAHCDLFVLSTSTTDRLPNRIRYG
jgi:hypothetical protein